MAAACTCSTHLLQQPQVGLLYTVRTGAGARAAPVPAIAAPPSAMAHTPSTVGTNGVNQIGRWGTA